jgi:TetR/AcrR family tetracycline transcriptional repressor
MAARVTPSTREPLSRESIAAGALALADREGLEAVTIRRLAQENSVTPMALYWHFKDKDAVLDGIAERLFADVELPEPIGLSWDHELRRVLAAVLAAVRPHPLAAELMVMRTMRSESGLVLAERVIGILIAAGFSPAEAAQAGSFLLCSIVTLVVTEPRKDNTVDDETWDDHYRAKRAELESLSPKKYPNLLAAAEFFMYCPSEDDYYDRGLDFLISGTVGVRTP